MQPDQKETEKSPLLPVKPQRLGDEIFRLDFSEGAPILLINKDVGDYHSIAKHPGFFALAYPTVIREVLTRVVVIDKHDDDANPDDWRSQWLRFAKLSPGLGELPSPDDSEERFDWVDKAVASFAKRVQTSAKFTEFWKGETEK